MLIKTVIPLLFILTGCTYSINLVHSHAQGHAYDLIDDSDETRPSMVIPPEMI